MTGRVACLFRILAARKLEREQKIDKLFVLEYLLRRLVLGSVLTFTKKIKWGVGVKHYPNAIITCDQKKGTPD